MVVLYNVYDCGLDEISTCSAHPDTSQSIDTASTMRRCWWLVGDKGRQKGKLFGCDPAFEHESERILRANSLFWQPDDPLFYTLSLGLSALD